jgi:hypothetical protein
MSLTIRRLRAGSRRPRGIALSAVHRYTGLEDWGVLTGLAVPVEEAERGRYPQTLSCHSRAWMAMPPRQWADGFSALPAASR